jgi:hypothetical protein
MTGISKVLLQVLTKTYVVDRFAADFCAARAGLVSVQQQRQSAVPLQ